MKKTILISSASFLCFFSIAQITGHEGHNHDAAPAAAVVKDDILKLANISHDFGKIPQGKPVYYNFEITNTGKEPLKLDNVQASCGCTTPEWRRDAIAPGASATIKVGYNAAAEGYFDKPITITYGGGQAKQIKITGIVWKAPEGSAPVNASVQFLKKQSL